MAGSDDADANPSKQRSRSSAGSVPLADIARVAQVSEATVSRVLNRKYGVAPATRETVEAAMRAIGFKRSMQGEIVLVLTPSFVNPFFAELCDQIAAELVPQGLHPVVCPIALGTTQELDYVEALIDARVAAVVFLSSSNTLVNAEAATRELLLTRGIPTIDVNGHSSQDSSPVISTDDWTAAHLAVTHLYDLGHRRIGMCAGPTGNIPADRRVDGFRQSITRIGLDTCDAAVVRHPFTVEGGGQAGTELIAMGMTGIVASSDEMALGAIRAVHRAGKQVPQDVSVIGYDDSRLLEFTEPPLTTVRQPIDRLAANTVQTIVAMMANQDVSTEEMLIEPEIRLRRSTGPAPGLDA